MSKSDAQTLSVEENPSPVADSEREALLQNPVLGRVFTDHMVTIEYSPERIVIWKVGSYPKCIGLLRLVDGELKRSGSLSLVR